MKHLIHLVWKPVWIRACLCPLLALLASRGYNLVPRASRPLFKGSWRLAWVEMFRHYERNRNAAGCLRKKSVLSRCFVKNCVANDFFGPICDFQPTV